MRAVGDHFVRQGRDADALAAELRTPEERRRYVATFRWERADVLNGAVRAFLRDLL